MVKKELEIKNPQGIHMRPANEFASAMGEFLCEVTVVYRDNEINGKSLMNMIAAGIRGGSTVLVICEGEDENEALEKAEEIINSGFGEM